MTGTRHRGRVALVTGGGGGIGRAVARALAAEGAIVAVAGRRIAALDKTLSDIDAGPGRGEVFGCDVTDRGQVDRLVALVVEKCGGLHMAVNAAGVPSWGSTAEIDPREWAEVVDTNLNGTWNCLRREIGHMRDNGGGTIVNVSSRIGAHMRVENQGAYAAAKSAISALTRTAARECIRHGVRINAVSPGPTDTGMAVWPGETAADRDARIAREVPIGRLAEPAEIAAAVAWLLSDESGFVVGHDLVIDGGISA